MARADMLAVVSLLSALLPAVAAQDGGAEVDPAEAAGPAAEVLADVQASAFDTAHATVRTSRDVACQARSWAADQPCDRPWRVRAADHAPADALNQSVNQTIHVPGANGLVAEILDAVRRIVVIGVDQNEGGADLLDAVPVAGGLSGSSEDTPGPKVFGDVDEWFDGVVNGGLLGPRNVNISGNTTSFADAATPVLAHEITLTNDTIVWEWTDERLAEGEGWLVEAEGQGSLPGPVRVDPPQTPPADPPAVPSVARDVDEPAISPPELDVPRVAFGSSQPAPTGSWFDSGVSDPMPGPAGASAGQGEPATISDPAAASAGAEALSSAARGRDIAGAGEPGRLVAGALGGAALVLPFLRLYRRIIAGRVLDNGERRRIHDAVLAAPGLTPGDVRAETGLHYTTCLHHLRVLESCGLIELKRMGGRWRAFENHGRFGHRETTVLGALRSGTANEILRVILRKPGVTPVEVARGLDLARSTVKHHVDRLAAWGLVAVEPAGKNIRLHLAPRTAEALLDVVSANTGATVRARPPGSRA